MMKLLALVASVLLMPCAHGAAHASDAPSVALDSGKVVIRARDSEAHGLPPVEVSVDLEGSGMSARRFPDAGAYLHLSGPPGGPLGLRVASFPSRSLDDYIKERYSRQAGFQMGAGGFTSLRNVPHASIFFRTGLGPAAADHCIILFQADTRKGEGVIVEFWKAGAGLQPRSCEEQRKDSPWNALLKSLRINDRSPDGGSRY